MHRAQWIQMEVGKRKLQRLISAAGDLEDKNQMGFVRDLLVEWLCRQPPEDVDRIFNLHDRKKESERVSRGKSEEPHQPPQPPVDPYASVSVPYSDFHWQHPEEVSKSGPEDQDSKTLP
jgi:hypothetical protein